MSESQNHINPKDTIKTNFKNTKQRKMLSIASIKLNHASSSNFKQLEKIDEDDKHVLKDEHSVSVNSIDVKVDKKKKVPHNVSDYSFDLDEKPPQNQADRFKMKFEDKQLAKLDELQRKHDSIMSGSIHEIEESHSEHEEHKDLVGSIKMVSKIATNPIKHTNSTNELLPVRPNSSSLAPPPKTAFIRSKSLLQMEKARPTSANTDLHSNIFDENSVAGSIRSVVGRQKSNFELLRVSPSCILQFYIIFLLASEQSKFCKCKCAV